MKITFTPLQVLYTVTIVGIVSFILITRHNYRREIDRLNTGLYQANNDISNKDMLINTQRQYIFTADASVVSSQAMIKKLKEEREYFEKLHIKDLKSISKLELEVNVLKKQGQYRDTLIVRDTIFSADNIGADTFRYVNWADPYAWAQVLLYPDNPVISLGLYESPMRVHIYYKGWIKPLPLVTVSTPNPYIKINSANTIIVEEDKKLLQKRYPYFIAGLITSFLIFK